MKSGTGQNDTEYDKYHRHDKTRQSKRKPDGKHATQQSKLVDRGVQMLIDELHINKAEAKQLLQEQGSVKRHLTLTKQIIVSLKTTEV